VNRAKIGIFGGSGFYSFLKMHDELDVETPYGSPSASLKLSTIESKEVAFLPRHGEHHQYPPHMYHTGRTSRPSNRWASSV